MPVYTFRCRKCQQENIQIEHKIYEPHPTRHKGCGGFLVRTVSPIEVVYKGDGFYSTEKRLDEPAEGYE
jgi:predicted nucleic acid-binding Zn ribbon protein